MFRPFTVARLRAVAAAFAALVVVGGCSPAAPDSQARRPESSTPSLGGGPRIATLNLLGASHTDPGGDRPGHRPWRQRLRIAIRAVERHRVSVVAFQEMQYPQWRLFNDLRGGDWSVSPDGSMANTIAWRTADWRLITSRTLVLPYLGQRHKEYPLVQLEHRGHLGRVWFLNVHNPADVYRDESRDRATSLRRQIRTARRIGRTGEPLVLLGDFNARDEAFCPLARAGLRSSAGGGWAKGRCTLPEDVRIDWIFATDDIGLRGHVVDESLVERGASDHPLVVTTLRRP